MTKVNVQGALRGAFFVGELYVCMMAKGKDTRFSLVKYYINQFVTSVFSVLAWGLLNFGRGEQLFVEGQKMNTRLKILSGVVGLGFGLAASTPAAALVLITATVVQTNSNDCAGIFGGTGNTIPICDVGYALTPSAAVSPIIAKQNTPGAMEINGEFLTIDGTEFSISYDTGTTAAGSWTYLQGTGDPDVRYWVAKGGNDPFVLHWMVTDTDAAGACAGASDYNLACLNAAVAVTGGTWATGGNGLSHLSWYDTGSDGNGPPTGQAPEPGVLLLMGAGLLGLGMARRRKPA